MKLKPVSAIVSFILCIVSCKDRVALRTKPTDDFTKIAETILKGDLIRLQSDSILYDPRTMRVFDSIAVCYDNVGKTGYSLINLNNGLLLRRFARAGGGINEYNLNGIIMGVPAYANRIVAISQFNPPNRIFLNSIDSLVANYKYSPNYFYQFPKEISFTQSVLLNDSMVVGKLNFSRLDKNLFGLFNIKNNKLVTGLELSLIDDNDARYYDSTYFPWTIAMMGGSLEPRPGVVGELAFFSSKGDFIQIFRIGDKNKFASIYQKLYSLPTFNIVKSGVEAYSVRLLDDCKNGFNNITVTGDKIYALYNGKPAGSPGHADLSTSVVLVYDWTGKPLEKYKLDRDCYGIAIDPNNPQKLYGLSSFNNIGIIKFSLP